MPSLRLTLALVAALLLAAPAGTLARGTLAPPGNSGIDEYLETIPKAGGNQPPRRPGDGTGRAGLPPAQRGRLDRLGRDGRALAGLVESTGPRTVRRRLPEATGSSPLDKAIDALGGSDDGDGLGMLLPAILLAALLGTVALVLKRRRTAS